MSIYTCLHTSCGKYFFPAAYLIGRTLVFPVNVEKFFLCYIDFFAGVRGKTDEFLETEN